MTTHNMRLLMPGTHKSPSMGFSVGGGNWTVDPSSKVTLSVSFNGFHTLSGMWAMVKFSKSVEWNKQNGMSKICHIVHGVCVFVCLCCLPVKFQMSSQVCCPTTRGSQSAVEYAGKSTNKERTVANTETFNKSLWYFNNMTPSKFHFKEGPAHPLLRLPVPLIPSRPCL